MGPIKRMQQARTCAAAILAAVSASLAVPAQALASSDVGSGTSQNVWITYVVVGAMGAFAILSLLWRGIRSAVRSRAGRNRSQAADQCWNPGAEQDLVRAMV